MENENKFTRLQEYIAHLERQNTELTERLEFLEKKLRILEGTPFTVGTVTSVLRNNKAVVRISSGYELCVNILPDIAKKVKEGDKVLLSKNHSAIIKILESREIETFLKLERPSVSWSDIGGLEKQIEVIRDIVELPLKEPEKFKEMGIEPPKGVLLYGPPGTGKTLLAKAVANEVSANFIYVVGSEFSRKYVGEGAELVRRVFKTARENRPCILFIDEIDAIASKRLYGESGAERETCRTLNQLLAELDGFKSNQGIIVMGATNRLDVIDEAILRPGRFDVIIEVPSPDKEAREKIFKIKLSKTKTEGKIDFEELAELTKGFTGADIEMIVKDAGIRAIKENRYIKHQDLVDAIKEFKRRRGDLDVFDNYSQYRVSVY